MDNEKPIPEILESDTESGTSINQAEESGRQPRTDSSTKGETEPTAGREADRDFYKELEEKLKLNLERKIEGSQSRVIEALGIFAAIVAFILVNVQIFSRVENIVDAALFMVLMVGCLGIFVLILDLVVHNFENFRPRAYAVLFLLVMVTMIMALFWKRPLNSTTLDDVSKNAIKQYIHQEIINSKR